jgi:hypothetical protein
MSAPRTGLGSEFHDALDARLVDADNALRWLYPGDNGTRQPIYTVYVPPTGSTPDRERVGRRCR